MIFRVEWRYFRFDKIQNGHNFATGLPIDVMFGYSVMFSGSADLTVQLSITLSDPEPQFQGHNIVYRRISRKRCIHYIFGSRLGFPGPDRRSEWRYFRFVG